MAKKPKSPTEITLIRHKKDTRVNIPTEELRDSRDPSLDPQLVWKGKDEQDQASLEAPVVPIYIQEKVHPQALVENLRDTAWRKRERLQRVVWRTSVWSSRVDCGDVFGELDIKITPDGDDGHLVVEVSGVDVYDPTTGQIRSSSTDDIACSRAPATSRPSLPESPRAARCRVPAC